MRDEKDFTLKFTPQNPIERHERAATVSFPRARASAYHQLEMKRGQKNGKGEAQQTKQRFTTFSDLLARGLSTSLVETAQFLSKQIYQTPYTKAEIQKR